MSSIVNQGRDLDVDPLPGAGKVQNTDPDARGERYDAVTRILAEFTRLEDEDEIIQQISNFVLNWSSAHTVSYVALNEHNQPMAFFNKGEIPDILLRDWLEYLASPVIRQRCQHCEKYERPVATCPLIARIPVAAAHTVTCIPLRRGSRLFGILNIFLAQGQFLDQESLDILRLVVEQAALTIENSRLRLQEIKAHQHLQALIDRQDRDNQSYYRYFVESVYQALEADFAILWIFQSRQDRQYLTFEAGDLSKIPRDLLHKMMIEEPAVKPAVHLPGSEVPGGYALLGVGLEDPGAEPWGALVVGRSENSGGYSLHHRALLQNFAALASQTRRNSRMLVEYEYRAVMQERIRLAREIHDGLAQTLGFLKLQLAQMDGQLSRGDVGQLEKNISLCYQTVSDAYIEVRQVIDDLRIDVAKGDASAWLEQVVAGFEEMSRIPVTLNIQAEFHLPFEVQAQLLRIVQEALSNVRKYAQAQQVWIDYLRLNEELFLEVRDDGLGFCLLDQVDITRHGIKGMQERAELIGARFQITSQEGGGTCVQVCLPLKTSQKEESPR